jgi:hypothetical protein
MPVLFAADIAAAKQAMSANPTTLRKDLDKINRMFFTPESVDLEGADSVIRKPRLGEAIYTFKDQNLEKLLSSPGMIITYKLLPSYERPEVIPENKKYTFYIQAASQ